MFSQVSPKKGEIKYKPETDQLVWKMAQLPGSTQIVIRATCLLPAIENRMFSYLPPPSPSSFYFLFCYKLLWSGAEGNFWRKLGTKLEPA